jgi:ABC-type multidrug transport system fused ATPase/permease subunit
MTDQEEKEFLRGQHSINLDLEAQAQEKIYGDDWTESAQDQLERWRKEASLLSDWHDQARSIFTKQRDSLNLPVIFLSGLTTVLIGTNSIGTRLSPSIALSSLVVSGITTFISGVNAFYSPAERVSRHIDASNQYAALVKNIDYTLHLPPHKRPDVEVSYVEVTSAFAAIGGTAPPIPRKLKQSS